MADRSRIRVLVVDDEPFIRESLTMFLGKKGFQVASAESGEQALSLLSESPRDVVIADMSLPGMGGDAMVRCARELLPSIHFFIHTAASDSHLSEQLASAGIRPDHVFIKPIRDLTVIIDKIDALMISDGSK
ncbi:MAG: response regulator [Desulfobacterales bacterium]|nr:response regulator [Desulfobacterales bacterium]